MISEHYLKAVEERVHDEAAFLKSPDGPAGLTILVLDDIPKLIADVRALMATCGDCKAPISEPWHFRCWWCKLAFCRDCAGKHFGGPGNPKFGSASEHVGNMVCDDRARTLKLIEDEQAFLTAEDKRLLRERLLDLWSHL